MMSTLVDGLVRRSSSATARPVIRGMWWSTTTRSKLSVAVWARTSAPSPARRHEVTGALEHVADEVADVGLVVRDEAAQGHGTECGPRRALLSCPGAILGRM